MAAACALAALLGLTAPASGTGDTVDIDPVHPAATKTAKPDTPGVDVPELPPATIEPLSITPAWDMHGFDVTRYSTPASQQELIDYLKQGYTPADDELSLYAAIALALRYNHDINRRRLEADAACAGVGISWAQLRPQLGLSAKSFVQGNNADTSGTGQQLVDSTEGDLTTQLALSLTQSIYDWGLTNNLVERDRAQFAVKAHVVDIGEQQLVYNVTTSYYGFSLALGQLRIREDALALAREFQRQAQIQYDVGTVPKLDVIRAEARVEQARDDLTAAQAALGDAAARFFSLLGVDYQRYVPSIVTTELLDVGAAPPDVDSAVTTGLDNRPEVDMQFATLLAGEAAVKLARNRPMLQGYANSLLQNPATSRQGSQNYELGVQLLWNVYTGGKDKAQRRQAELSVDAISEGLNDLDSNIELDVTTSWNKLTAARSSVESARKGLDLSGEALRAAAVGYSAGVTPFIEFQDALDRNIQAALGYLAALVAVKTAQSNLDRATGFPDGFPGGITAAECEKLAEPEQSAQATVSAEPAPKDAVAQVKSIDF